MRKTQLFESESVDNNFPWHVGVFRWKRRQKWCYRTTSTNKMTIKRPKYLCDQNSESVISHRCTLFVRCFLGNTPAERSLCSFYSIFCVCIYFMGARGTRTPKIWQLTDQVLLLVLFKCFQNDFKSEVSKILLHFSLLFKKF